MKKQTKDFLAEAISRIFGPPVELPVVILFLLYAVRPTISQILKLAPSLLFFCWLLPVFYFAYNLKRGAISDLDARNRQERLPTYTLTLIGWTIGLVLAKFWGNEMFLRLYFSFFALIFILVFTTYFYKISIHAALNTALFLFVNLHWNFKFWGFLFLIPLVLWARWYKKNHDVGQLALGALAGAIVMFASLKI